MLGADGITIVNVHTLGNAYSRIAERADYYVALLANPPGIDLLDKKTLTTIRHILLPRASGRTGDSSLQTDQLH